MVLPAFFTTGLAFDDSMLNGHRPLRGEPLQLLKELASEGDATVAGSFLAERWPRFTTRLSYVQATVNLHARTKTSPQAD